MGHYSLISHDQKPVSQHDMLRLIERVCATSGTVCVINYYNEFPIISRTGLVKVADDCYRVRLRHSHLPVASQERTVIVNFDNTPLLADCTSVDPDTCTVDLSGFRFIRVLSELRQSFRVRMDDFARASVQCDNTIYLARLVDLSATGCRVSLTGNLALTYPEVTLDIKLFNRDCYLAFSSRITAVIVRTYQRGERTFYGMSFQLAPSVKDKLVALLNYRQLDMVKALGCNEPAARSATE